MTNLSETLGSYQQRLTQAFDAQLTHTTLEPTLGEAMKYGVLNGGKRIRPALVYMVNQLLGGNLNHADPAAVAIECLHSYSLVHDDLPAMDDDDLRRGKPTCHIKFDEATAILAGDGLLTFAFELLTQGELSAEQKVAMVATLAKSAGPYGMVGGQAFDLAHVDKPLTLVQLEAMHNHKTGELILAAIELGAISANATADDKKALAEYGAAIGLAFQVQDDILDIEGSTEELGKPQGSDLAAHKPTYPSLLGLDGAKEKLNLLHQQAVKSLEPFGEAAAPLIALADFIVTRTH
ncbi:MAG: polyprenyl synthetase family protein [Pontibacterium sp.]